MDLGTKLSMLNRKDYNPDEELAGISRPIQEQIVAQEDPDDEPCEFVPSVLSVDQYLFDSGYKPKSKPADKKKRRHTEREFLDGIALSSQSTEEEKPLDKITDVTRQLVQEAELAQADEFDRFMSEGGFSAEEDAEMRTHLVSLGRKYARDSAQSKESSEISRTFSDSEKRLKALYEEIERDKQDVSRDIERMRVPGRGGKILSDLIGVKKELQATQLSIIDKTNTMRKTIFELRAKEAARREAENAGNSDINANTLQNLFSSARSSMVESMGGYGRVSGASDEDDPEPIFQEEMSDEEIQKRYFGGNESSEDSDGDKYLRYEGRGVGYVLLIDEDDNVQSIIAEDKDGIMIPDYPMPSNIDQLSFTFDKIAMTATDNMHRNYSIRIISD